MARMPTDEGRPQRLTYKDAGVDRTAGDQASKLLYEAAKRSWPNRIGKLGEVLSIGDQFRVTRFAELHNGFCVGFNLDGVGTKVELAERLGEYRGLCFDLVAMTCDDAAVQWAEPLHFGSIVDMGRVQLDIVRELAAGFVEAATVAGVAIVNGELAELPGRLRGFESEGLNLGGVCVWVGDRKRLGGGLVQSGDLIIGVQEQGFRCNGYSLIRRVLEGEYGSEWGTGPGRGGDLAVFAARPSMVYTPLILSLTGGLNSVAVEGVRSFIHVTGGGLMGRLEYSLRSTGLGASISNLPRPPMEMLAIAELGAVSLEEAYRTWNMGVGLLVICSREAGADVLGKIESQGLRGAEIGLICEGGGLEFRAFDGSTTLRSA